MEPSQARAIPVRIGSPEQFQAVRTGLQQLQYTEASICARTGAKNIFGFKSKAEGRKSGRDVNDALDALIHLLMDGETMEEARARSLLPVGLVDALIDLGVLASVPNKPGELYGTVFLYPVEGLYVISDRTILIDGGEGAMLADAVFSAISLNTERFLAALPATPCESMLDLCAGTGIAAMAAARNATHAWSCDLVPRSVAFAEFNRQLNGLENVTCAQGDLYEPVAGLTFDRIVAHPPYVPAEEQKVLFRDGGEDGEQILRGVIEGLPRYLRPGGRCYAVSMATDREGESVEQRIRRWLGAGEQEFDVMLVAYSIQTKPEFVVQVMKEKNLRWLQVAPRNELLERLKATAIFYGAMVIERKTAARPAITVRTRKSEEAASPAIEWYVRWHTSAAAPGFDESLLNSRPHPAAQLRLNVMHTPENGKLTPTRFELASEYPFTVQAECPNWLAVVVSACDGQKSARDVFEDMKRQEVIHPATTPQQFLRDIRDLISYGLLEVDEFPLPCK